MNNRKYFVGMGAVTILLILVAIMPQNLAQGDRSGLDFGYFNATNLTHGGGGNGPVQVAPGDELRFETKLINNTGDFIKNVGLRIYLPNNLRFISESVAVSNWSNYIVSSNTPVVQPVRISAGDLWPGEERIVVFNVRVTDAPRNTNLITAQLESDDTHYTASAQISISVGDPAEIGLGQYNPLTLDKVGRNLSHGDTQWSKSVEAQPGDMVEFKISVSTVDPTGAYNVLIKEELDPGYLYYQDGTMRINNRQTYINSINNPISLGDLVHFQNIEVTLRANVAPAYQFTQRETTVANIIHAWNTGFPELRAASGVHVTNYLAIAPLYSYQPTPTPYYPTPTPTYHASSGQDYSYQTYRPTPTPTVSTLPLAVRIDKLVRNVSAGSLGYGPQVNAAPGDELEFIIYLHSESNAEVNNLTLADELPDKLSYLPGSTQLDRQPTNDSPLGYGMNIDQIRPNETRAVTYRTKVVPRGEFTNGPVELRAAANLSGEGVQIDNNQSMVSILIDPNSKTKAVASGLAAWFWPIVILLLIADLLLLVLWQKERRRVELIVTGRLA